MTATARQEYDAMLALSEELVDRLDFVDALVLFALARRAPDDLAHALARTIAATTEVDGLAQECRGYP